MSYQLHVDPVINMRITPDDAELLCKAILCAGHQHFSDTFDNASWERLTAMRKQLAQLNGWKKA